MQNAARSKLLGMVLQPTRDLQGEVMDLNAKVNRGVAEYVKQSLTDRCCGNCTMYRDYGPISLGMCDLVEGAIDRDGYCRFWQKARQ